MSAAPRLEIRNLAIHFATETGTVEAVKGISCSRQKAGAKWKKRGGAR